jgi:hypothetical protein
MEPTSRVETALARWEQTQPLSRELRNCLTYLDGHCQDVEIVHADATYYAMYTVRDQDGRLRYFAGGNPLAPEPDSALRAAWPQVPSAIRAFYDLHDGFFDFPNGAGLSPQRWVCRLADEDWGIIETLTEPVRVNLATTFGFVSNSAGGYLVVDVTDSADEKATLWWAKDPPDYDLNFWDVADEWLYMFLAEP